MSSEPGNTWPPDTVLPANTSIPRFYLSLAAWLALVGAAPLPRRCRALARSRNRPPASCRPGELPLALKPGAERLALDVGHGEPEAGGSVGGGGVTRIQDGEDVGMLQPGGRYRQRLQADRSAGRLPLNLKPE
jgi:hypothetical protein